MPCIDHYAERESQRELARELNFLRAALCATMTALESTLKDIAPDSDVPRFVRRHTELSKIHGISEKELRTWWENHKRDDERRRLAELEEKKHQRAKKAALAKLSKQDKVTLGIKDK